MLLKVKFAVVKMMTGTSQCFSRYPLFPQQSRTALRDENCRQGSFLL